MKMLCNAFACIKIVQKGWREQKKAAVTGEIEYL